MTEKDTTVEKRKLPFGLIVSFLIVMVLAGGGFYLYNNLGSIVEKTAERIATKTLGVPVEIGAVIINFQDKAVTVTDLEISNPKGYKNPHAMTIGKINIAANSLSKEMLVFKEISTDDTNLYLEVTPKGTNFNALYEGIDRSPKETQATAEPIKVIIEKVSIARSTLHPSVTVVDIGTDKITMPNINLTGIGRKENGVVASEAIAQIVNHVITVATEAAFEAGLMKGLEDRILGKIGSELNIEGMDAEKIQNLKDSIKDSEKLEDAAKKAIGGFFE